jgi:hypothetical protein
LRLRGFPLPAIYAGEAEMRLRSERSILFSPITLSQDFSAIAFLPRREAAFPKE